MKAIIIDDELKSREVLGKIVDQFIDGLTIVGGAGDIQGGVELIEKSQPDLVFLDISLQDGDSFAILNQLHKIDFKIIFITAFDEYATQAISFTRIPCLSKPIDLDELEDAIKTVSQTEIVVIQEDVSIILNILNSRFDIIPIIDVFKVMFINASQIIYMNKKGNETEMFLKDGSSAISWYPFAKYIHLLKNHSFAQPNKDNLVFLNNIEKYPKHSDSKITLCNGKYLPLSENYKTDFIKRFGKHIL